MLQKAINIKDYIVDIRRKLHANPELAYQEYETAKFICSKLDDLQIKYKTGIAKTGIIAELIKGNGPTILLRADMDALPMTENTNLDFSSKIHGKMHACGHDIHMASLLGAAKLLKEESFQGTIRFLFQPAEEGGGNTSDGYSGAHRMVQEGVTKDVNAAITFHQSPLLQTGKIAVYKKAAMAAADFFRIRIKGKSSHAGNAPHEGIDSIIIAAQLINSLQTIISRTLSPYESGVLSITTINGGTAANIIAESVEMSGTLRALSEETHQLIINRIKETNASFAKLYNAKIDFEIYHGVPVTINDPKVEAITRAAAIKVLGPQNVIESEPLMAGEDFAYIAQKVPASLVSIGSKTTTDPAYGLHDPRCIINEDSLPIATAYFAQSALDLLSNL